MPTIKRFLKLLLKNNHNTIDNAANSRYNTRMTNNTKEMMMRERNTKTARDLVKGDVVASGEIVTKKAVKINSQGKQKAAVNLLNQTTGKRRLAFWGFYSSIFMKNENKARLTLTNHESSDTIHI